MLAAHKRERQDRRISLLIRSTSIVVLVAIAGMLVQMMMTAVPLLSEPTIQPVAADEVPTSLSELRSSRPSWLPADYPMITWRDTTAQRLWVGVSPSKGLTGSLSQWFAADNQWRVTPLRFDPALPSVAFVDLLPAPGWLLGMNPDGNYWLYSLSNSAEDSVAPENLSGVVPEHTKAYSLPGERAYLLAGDSVIHQVHIRFVGAQPALEKLREFSIPAGVGVIAPAPAGQRFLVIDREGHGSLWHTTTGRQLASLPKNQTFNSAEWLAPDSFLTESKEGERQAWRIDVSQGTVTLSTLFGRVHFEGYEAPVRAWQPAAGAEGYEGKYSFLPLLMGTLRAAVLAMLVALPVAIGAAVFTGFFMPERLRDRIKTAIELIAAFPTVVVGAVFAILLGPFVIDSLAQLVGLFLLPPVGIALLGIFWRAFPIFANQPRWLFALPVVLLPVFFSLALLGYQAGDWFEQAFLGGSVLHWLAREAVVDVQYRNGIVVGLALGMAVIPTIFTVAEDAIHAVPRSAAMGSLALGATHWGSFRDVVLPVAFPGIVAAIMLGFGRAIGETMILLLVAGNAPISEFDLFTSLRTISATLAIELPESAVASSHFRILFLAAFLLFLITFFFNTLAEVIKLRFQREFGFEE